MRILDRARIAIAQPIRLERERGYDVDVIGLGHRIADERIVPGIDGDQRRIRDRADERAGHRDLGIDRGRHFRPEGDLGREHGHVYALRAGRHKVKHVRIAARVGHGVRIADRITVRDQPAIGGRDLDRAPHKLVRAHVRSRSHDARVAVQVLRDHGRLGNVFHR